MYNKHPVPFGQYEFNQGCYESGGGHAGLPAVSYSIALYTIIND